MKQYESKENEPDGKCTRPQDNKIFSHEKFFAERESF